VGKESHRVRVPVNFSGKVCALGVVVGGAPVILVINGEVYGGRRDSENSRA
jgi:hypothetical protein